MTLRRPAACSTRMKHGWRPSSCRLATSGRHGSWRSQASGGGHGRRWESTCVAPAFLAALASNHAWGSVVCDQHWEFRTQGWRLECRRTGGKGLFVVCCDLQMHRTGEEMLNLPHLQLSPFGNCTLSSCCHWPREPDAPLPLPFKLMEE